MDPREEYSPVLKRLINEEISDIDPHFNADIAAILSARGFNPEKAMQDMHLYYPFWLSCSFNSPGMDAAVDELTRFNLWFGFYALIQDDLLDLKNPDGDQPKKVLFSSYFLFKALVHLNKLIQTSDCKIAVDISAAEKIDVMAKTNELYDDYINCILWEKGRSQDPRPYSETDIRWLGKKFSMLKINNFVLANLAHRKVLTEELDRFLEDYHVCMQIIDDIKDWKSDLENGNLSYVLWSVQNEYGIPLKVENLEKLDNIVAYSGIVKKASEKAIEYLHSALSEIESLDNPYLIELVIESEKSIESIIRGQEQNVNALLKDVELRLTGACSQQ